jgi:hypothetical protein
MLWTRGCLATRAQCLSAATQRCVQSNLFSCARLCALSLALLKGVFYRVVWRKPRIKKVLRPFRWHMLLLFTENRMACGGTAIGPYEGASDEVAMTC